MLWLKKCPSCGSRFGVSVVEKDLLDSERETSETTRTVLVPAGRGMNVGTGNPVTAEVEATTQRDTFETHFQCSKCGHKWSEKSTVFRKT